MVVGLRYDKVKVNDFETKGWVNNNLLPENHD